MMAGPVIRVAVDLGDHRPIVDDEDQDWRPVTYTIRAHHAATLDPRAERVVERRLERITLEREDEYDVDIDGPSRVEVELPATLEGLEALADLIDHARDYVRQDAQEPRT